MSDFCIDPLCHTPLSNEDEHCPNCGMPIFIHDRYLPAYPIKLLPDPYVAPGGVEVWVVKDMEGTSYCPPGGYQIMRLQFGPTKETQAQFIKEITFLKQQDGQGIPRSEGHFIEIRGYSKGLAYSDLNLSFQEFIEASTLLKIIESGLKPNHIDVLAVAQKLLELLLPVHRNRWLHGDIKPENIMLNSEGQIYLIDWGSVNHLDLNYTSALSTGLNVDPYCYWLISTESTIGYGGKEQAQGKPVPQSDLIGVGMTLIHYATGQHPSTLPTDPEMISGQDRFKICWHELAPTVEPYLKEWIDSLIDPHPAYRPANAELALGQLNCAVEQFTKQQEVQNQRRPEDSPKKLRRWIAAAIIGGLTGILGISYGISAVRYSPQTVDVVEAARQAEQMGDLKLARRLYEQALRSDPNVAVIHNNLGLVCQSLTDFSCAEKSFKASIQLEPNQPIAFFNLAALAEDQGNVTAARAYYQKSIALGKGRFFLATINLARLNNLAGQPQQALSLLDSIPLDDLGPMEQWGYLKNQGWALMQQKKYNKAIPALEAATRTDPATADPYCLLGLIAQARGQPDQVFREACNSKWSLSPEVRDWQKELNGKE